MKSYVLRRAEEDYSAPYPEPDHILGPDDITGRWFYLFRDQFPQKKRDCFCIFQKVIEAMRDDLSCFKVSVPVERNYNHEPRQYYTELRTTGEELRRYEEGRFGQPALLVDEVTPAYPLENKSKFKSLPELVKSAELLEVGIKAFTNAWVNLEVDLYIRLKRCWGRLSTENVIFDDDFSEAIWEDDYQLPYDEFDDTRYLLDGYFIVSHKGASAATLMTLYGSEGHSAQFARAVHGKIMGLVITDREGRDYRCFGLDYQDLLMRNEDVARVQARLNIKIFRESDLVSSDKPPPQDVEPLSQHETDLRDLHLPVFRRDTDLTKALSALLLRYCRDKGTNWPEIVKSKTPNNFAGELLRFGESKKVLQVEGEAKATRVIRADSAGVYLERTTWNSWRTTISKLF